MKEQFVFGAIINKTGLIYRAIFRISLISALLFFYPGYTGLHAGAQKADPNDPKNKELGIELIKLAIEARGGSAYLGYRTLLATGQYTPFDKGFSQIPQPFIDLIAYPDKERVEFGKGKKKNIKIQVNSGKTGWLYDGDAQTLKDQTDKQIQDYLEGLEFDIDRILRGGWQQPGTEVRFHGREELRPGERADVVLIQINPERKLFLWLDRNTHLPLTLIYEKAGDGGLVKHEVRFFQFVGYDGVKFPNIVDFYRNGIQESRINYQTVKLGIPANEEQFIKPSGPKAVK
ncbi:MAG: hypothetical protein IPO77_05430 [Acidobacteria bacterium]|nr:hypothetical protein [Acidobacteriota bacterium]